MPVDKTRRRFLTGAGAGIAAAVAGCAGEQSEETPTDGATDESSDTSNDDGDAAMGGTLQTAVTGKIESLDPIIKGTGGVNQWAEGLMDYDNGQFPPVPGLAEDVETIDGGQRYRFTLREGVTFHDGSELTASDVVYSFERTAQSENSGNADDIIGSTFTVEHEGNTAADLANYVPGSLGVTAVDERTVEIEMETPYFGSMYQLASESTFVVIPENTVGDIEREDVETDGEYGYQEAFGTENGGPKIAGTGPFEVEEWSKGDRLVLSRYDDYHGSVANIDGVRENILGGPEAAYDRALNGNLDLFEVPGTRFDPARRSEMTQQGKREIGRYTLANGTEVNFARARQLGTDVVLFNCNRTPAGVRKAMAAAINQHDVAANIYPDHAPAYTMTAPDMYPTLDEFDDPVAAQQAHYTEGAMAQTSAGEDGYPWGVDEADLDRAQQIVEDTGVAGNSYTLSVNNSQPAFQQFASRVQQKMRTVNVDISIEEVSYGTLISKGVFEGALDMYQLGDTAEVPFPDNVLRFYPPQVARRQASKWGPTDAESPDPSDPEDWEDRIQFEVARLWDENYVGNKAPTDAQAAERARAYLAVEEGTWHSVQMLPTAHRITREWWSTDVEYEPASVMGDKAYNDVAIDR